MKIRVNIILSFSATKLSQAELSQVVFDAYVNYAVVKHLAEELRLTLKFLKNDLEENLDKNPEIQRIQLFGKVINQASWKVSPNHEKTGLEIILDFPKDYDYDLYSEVQMRQVVYDMLVQHVCLSHGDDSIVWCSKAKMGSNKEVVEFRPLYEYHKNWFDICKDTEFEVALMKN